MGRLDCLKNAANFPQLGSTSPSLTLFTRLSLSCIRGGRPCTARVLRATFKTMYPLRTAGKGTLEWGAKIARIWVHKCTVLAGKDLFHRVGMVAISLKILKT